MDSDIKIMHVVGRNDFKPQSSVHTNIAPNFNRKETLNTARITDESIERIWKQRVIENPRLYNGTKFRVHSICDSTNSEGKIEINVGVTDYKTFLGTNWANHVKELQKIGKDIHNNPQVFLSDALGVGSFLVSIDNYVVFLSRNIHCAEAAGMWDVPGGHAEPKNIVGKLPLEQIDTTKIAGDDVCKEIFDSIAQEIIDEVNIPSSNLEKPLYMGTVRNTTSGGRPSLEFYVRCSLTREEIHSNYHKGNQLEADESTNIKFVSLDEINCLQSKNRDFWKQLAPSAKGCITLYQIVTGIYHQD